MVKFIVLFFSFLLIIKAVDCGICLCKPLVYERNNEENNRQPQNIHNHPQMNVNNNIQVQAISRGSSLGFNSNSIIGSTASTNSLGESNVSLGADIIQHMAQELGNHEEFDVANFEEIEDLI